MFEKIDEIRVARTGWAGPACVDTVRHERRVLVRTWHDGRWREEHPQGDGLVWFPDPIGGRDCRTVTARPRCSSTRSEPCRASAFSWVSRPGAPASGAAPVRPEWGAARVEVWGRRDGTLDCVVYGVVERTAVAAGAVLAVVAARLAGALGRGLKQPGVHGLAALVEPVPFLAELAQRVCVRPRSKGWRSPDLATRRRSTDHREAGDDGEDDAGVARVVLARQAEDEHDQIAREQETASAAENITRSGRRHGRAPACAPERGRGRDVSSTERYG